jgi:hypothetical protein
MFPEAITSEAAKAAMNTFIPSDLSGRQINAATITEMKVIRKLIGRISFIIAVSFSVKAEKVLMKDSPKLTKRINICWGV